MNDNEYLVSTIDRILLDETEEKLPSEEDLSALSLLV